ncbi:MAG: c-type cytochrome [Thioalkalispiraceae bacterium]|jgi:thiosulfate dehydrogenase
MRDIKKLWVVSMVLLLPLSVMAEEDNQGDMVAEGGRLYDKWWEEYDLEKPTTTHPSYPARGQQSGAATWRCKECHGWDYRGRQGAYGSGSHYTGIRGISAYAGRKPELIMAVLKNPLHRFDEVMLDYGLLRVALFVSRGQVDISRYVDENTNKVAGNLRRGQQIYNQSCKECHGRDGRERNFGDDDKPEYVGTVAVKNPWEAMHKLRNGQPGAFVMGDPMPHMNTRISFEQQLDLLAYLQSLPVK